jgi:hypothetical protein
MQNNTPDSLSLPGVLEEITERIPGKAYAAFACADSAGVMLKSTSRLSSETELIT